MLLDSGDNNMVEVSAVLLSVLIMHFEEKIVVLHICASLKVAWPDIVEGR